MHAESDSDTTRVGASTASHPWAQVSTRRPGGGPRAGSYWWHVVLLLGLVVVCSSLACAPQFVGPTTRGYFFALNDPILDIDLGDAAELIVSVRNAQGQPVDNLPVTFQVEPGWAQSASVLPQVAYTRQGRARALFQASTTGVVHVTVRVDNTTREARITVASRPSPPDDE
jgi:hypothetical protein